MNHVPAKHDTDSADLRFEQADVASPGEVQDLEQRQVAFAIIPSATVGGDQDQRVINLVSERLHPARQPATFRGWSISSIERTHRAALPMCRFIVILVTGRNDSGSTTNSAHDRRAWWTIFSAA
jgi:hypothetical protein